MAKTSKVVSIKPAKLSTDLPYAGFRLGEGGAMEGSCFDVQAANKLLRKMR